jgi:hypothetical protein
VKIAGSNPAGGTAEGRSLIFLARQFDPRTLQLLGDPTIIGVNQLRRALKRDHRGGAQQVAIRAEMLLFLLCLIELGYPKLDLPLQLIDAQSNHSVHFTFHRYRRGIEIAVLQRW